MAALKAAHRGYDLGGGILYEGAAHTVGALGREEFASEETEALPWHPYVLTPGGWWYGEDEPVHGACEGPESCPHPPPLPEPSPRAVSRYLEALPGDTLPVSVRCHL
ncbi:hypothetical protein ACE1OC_08350 [Streptomyces sp. DSM 116496]|uniref:hypothetical protein n=1 Tax=Streptomyces stoeckheimensis TaxID=3344656 RepID=UPI0038B293FE